MKHYLLFIAILCFACTPAPKTIDLDTIAKDKYIAFKYIAYRPGEMDYAYCDSASDIVDLKIENNKDAKKLIVVCLAVNNTYVRAQEKSKFYKYSQLDVFGKLTFCGWRDNYMKINKKGEVISNSPKIGNSGKCEGFSAYKYKHS
jgi:hypothetical protein